MSIRRRLRMCITRCRMWGASPSSPEVTPPMPTKESLIAVQKTLPAAGGPSHIPFIRDMLFFVGRTHTPSDSGTIIISDPPTRELAVAAATALIHILNVPPPHAEEPVYLWRLFHRLGMARLLGQLGLSPSPETAMQFLQEAAKRSSIESPHFTYVYGLLLLGEFTAAKVEERYYVPLILPGSLPTTEARKHIERPAYLGSALAQYKLGHVYEYAVPPSPSIRCFPFNITQQGEAEANVALSRWFSCGAEGAFEKDEGLTVAFADKAVKKGVHSAEFVMGYYAEVGIGQPKDLEATKKWQHGNTEAPARLSALSQAAPQSLSRTQHDTLTNDNTKHEPTAAEKVKMEVLEGATQKAPSVPPMPATLPRQRHASTMPVPPPHGQGSPAPSQGGPQQGRPFANAPRYTLPDTPIPPPSGASEAELHQHPS
ncbi:hypothetical protein M422DRAFT_254224 [Sphaerobolus stellatus SS14]|uniref:Uncharacterized protein n=1 Tax=Sphaerobolus stellatus (strain SS14) TaxID=990650 RepID=A0A0C9UI65_SPHS4|nr:hypothetical protein M422DRAFT_254224 [Sphaerobolus stellatus SS14]